MKPDRLKVKREARRWQKVMDEQWRLADEPVVMVPIPLQTMRLVQEASNTLGLPVCYGIQALLSRVTYDVKRDGCMEMPNWAPGGLAIASEAQIASTQRKAG